MPYGSRGKLPIEMASKLGHLSVINNEWVRALVEDFETSISEPSTNNYSIWHEVGATEAKPLEYVWAVDGSYVPVRSNPPTGKEVAFIKTALLSIDRNKLDRIDKLNPHPLLLQDLMGESALFHSTVLPLKNVKTKMGNNFDTIRNIIFGSLKFDQQGAYLETLKWIAYRKWEDSKGISPDFQCPYCDARITGLPYDTEETDCTSCGGKIFITDMLGFHLDMNEDSAPESIASSYMLIVETLMLFTIIRILWSHPDRNLFCNTLFIKDGPLTLRSQYSKIVPNIREFIEFTKQNDRPIHLISQEKSGAFFDHLMSMEKYINPKEADSPPSIAVLSHRYVRDEVYRTPELANPYGKRTNYGEKVFVKLDPDSSYVLNIPTGRYQDDSDFPKLEDIIGLDRILTTLPNLVSRRFESALFPIELANGVASLSSYPSSKILERYIECAEAKSK